MSILIYRKESRFQNTEQNITRSKLCYPTGIRISHLLAESTIHHMWASRQNGRIVYVHDILDEYMITDLCLMSISNVDISTKYFSEGSIVIKHANIKMYDESSVKYEIINKWNVFNENAYSIY